MVVFPTALYVLGADTSVGFIGELLLRELFSVVLPQVEGDCPRMRVVPESPDLETSASPVFAVLGWGSDAPVLFGGVTLSRVLIHMGLLGAEVDPS